MESAGSRVVELSLSRGGIVIVRTWSRGGIVIVSLTDKENAERTLMNFCCSFLGLPAYCPGFSSYRLFFFITLLVVKVCCTRIFRVF